VTSLSDAEISAFLDKLEAWRDTLTAGEQRVLDILIESATAGDDADAEGFTWRPERAERGWPAEPRRITRVLRRASDRP
jgi:hypothetical protein